MSHNTVAVDLYAIEIPHDQLHLLDAAWNELDEQDLAPEKRRTMRRYGFRAGVAGQRVPMPLAKLMNIEGKPAPRNEPARMQRSAAGIDAREKRCRLTFRPGEACDVQMSKPYDQLPLFELKDGELRGDTLYGAQAFMSITAYPESATSTRFELLPLVRHGDWQVTFTTGAGGAIQQETDLQREAIEELAMTIELEPGEMLVLGDTSDQEGGLGGYFFRARDAETGSRKIVILRLAQTQHDDRFELAR